MSPGLELSQSFRPWWHNVITSTYVFFGSFFVFDMAIKLQKQTGPKISRHLIAAAPSLAPILTMASVVLVVILERDLNVRGAILGDYSSWMSILFNFSVAMIVGSFIWAPIGMFLSFEFSKRLPNATNQIAYPLIFAIACILCILFAVVDPDGMMTYYLD